MADFCSRSGRRACLHRQNEEELERDRKRADGPRHDLTLPRSARMATPRCGARGEDAPSPIDQTDRMGPANA